MFSNLNRSVAGGVHCFTPLPIVYNTMWHLNVVANGNWVVGQFPPNFQRYICITVLDDDGPLFGVFLIASSC